MSNRSLRRGGKVSGRVFTTLFAFVLLAILIFGIPFVLRFERIQGRIEIVRQTWPPAAASIEEYYLAVDNWQNANQAMEPDMRRKWEGGMKEFRQSPLHEKQILAALTLEACHRNPSLNAQLQKEDSLLKAREKSLQSEAVILFEKAQKDLINIESDWLGNVTRTILRLKPTPQWLH